MLLLPDVFVIETFQKVTRIIQAMAARPWSRRQSARKGTDERGTAGRGVVTHRSPTSDTLLLPCCGRALSEVKAEDQVTTDPKQVTCHGLARDEKRRASGSYS
jgi:hypothetical protein